jgi:transcriptional regulator with XRE-family HTH domain
MPRTSPSAIASKVVGEQIRTTRKRLGLSQVAVADRLGVTGGYVASVEAGRYNLTLGQLTNFAAAMGVALDVRFSIPAEEPMHLAAASTPRPHA